MSVSTSSTAGRDARPAGYVGRVLAALRRDPDRPVVWWRDRPVTGAAMAADVVSVVAGLRAQGVRTGDTVALLTSANHPALLVGRYAAHLLGAAVVHVRSMNPRSDEDLLPARTQADVLAATGAGVLLADSAHLHRAAELGGQPVAEGPLTVLRLPTAAPGPPDCAVIGFTSGTTGAPKLVAQPFRMWERMVARLAAALDTSEPVALLAATPLSHSVGPMVDAVLGLGGTVILHETFDPAAVLRDAVTKRITDVYLAVPHLYRLIEHPDVHRLTGSALRRIVYSGTPAAPSRIAHAVRVFGGARLTQVYGSTEAGGIAGLAPIDHGEPELLGTVGKPFPWATVRVVDPSTGLDQAPGAHGEVWVRSDTVLTGYVGMPERTAEVLSPGGWLRTGDIGRWDRHGYLTLIGRLNRLINIDGLWVCPSTVEQALLAHPDVTSAAVYSIRDLDRVEYLHAAVELRPHASRRLPPLRDHVANLLSPLHAPHAYTLWDRMPTDETGRPDRARLRTRPVTGFVAPTAPDRTR